MLSVPLEVERCSTRMLGWTLELQQSQSLGCRLARRSARRGSWICDSQGDFSVPLPVVQIRILPRRRDLGNRVPLVSPPIPPGKREGQRALCEEKALLGGQARSILPGDREFHSDNPPDVVGREEKTNRLGVHRCWQDPLLQAVLSLVPYPEWC